jgi:transcription antitermination factor NusG
MVRTGGEPRVDASLRCKNFETFLPLYTRSRQYWDRIKTSEVALFPGYVFCRLDPRQKLSLMLTPGVHDVVRQGESVRVVDEVEIESLRQLIASQSNVIPWPYLKSGNRVRIGFGSMSGIEGCFVRDKGLDRLVLSISLLERSVSVEIDRAWVQPI